MAEKLGPTGKFPQGRMRADDDGETQIGIAIDSGVIMVAFGKPTTWLGLDAETAEQMAATLLEKARQLRAEAKK